MHAKKSNYADLLKDPRWQKKRLQIFKRDKFTCRGCGSKDNTLHVHHLKYQWGKDPWSYKNDELLTLCENCHTIVGEFNKHSNTPVTINSIRRLAHKEDGTQLYAFRSQDYDIILCELLNGDFRFLFRCNNYIWGIINDYTKEDFNGKEIH